MTEQEYKEALERIEYLMDLEDAETNPDVCAEIEKVGSAIYEYEKQHFGDPFAE